jgi:hypothetical protein
MVAVNCNICNQKESAKPYLDYVKSPTIPEDVCVDTFTEKKIYICESCESCFVYPSINNDELDDFYLTLYKGYPQKISLYHRLMPHSNGRYFSQVLYLKNFLDMSQCMQVLEIGSNITSLLPALSLLSNKIDFHYFDQVESPIIKKFGGKRVGSFAEPESISKKFRENSLDLIHMSHTLEHINPSSLQNMLKKCVRTLKVRGYIFIEVPFQLELENFYPPHTLFFSTKGLSTLFEGIGFKIIDLQLYNSSKAMTDRKNEDKKNPVPIIRKLNHLKTRILKLFLIIFLKVPAVVKFLLKLNYLSEVTSHDHRPFIRLLAQKASL